MKKLPNEEAVVIQDDLNNCIMFLFKHNLNEYIIEGVRKVVDIIVIDEEDDVSKLLPDKKADLIKLMISKIGELQGASAERKDSQSSAVVLIERLFE